MSKFGDCILKFVGAVAFYIKGLPEERRRKKELDILCFKKSTGKLCVSATPGHLCITASSKKSSAQSEHFENLTFDP